MLNLYELVMFVSWQLTLQSENKPVYIIIKIGKGKLCSLLRFNDGMRHGVNYYLDNKENVLCSKHGSWLDDVRSVR